MEMVILDAYNVIHKLPELSIKKSGLRDARRGLLHLMINWKRNKCYKGDIFLVFDGQDGVISSESSKLWGIKCVFTSSKEEADDRIISMVREASKADGIVVISEDGKVTNGCKVHGAKVQSPFFLKSKGKRKISITKSRGKGSLSSRVEREIDQYYKDALGL
jgi:predicted RNA-binding protein with PIN domain